MVFEIFDFRKSFERKKSIEKKVSGFFWQFLFFGHISCPTRASGIAQLPLCRPQTWQTHPRKSGNAENPQSCCILGYQRDFRISWILVIFRYFSKPAPLAVLQIPLPASAACLECVQGCLRLLQLSVLLQNRFGKNIFFGNFETRKN